MLNPSMFDTRLAGEKVCSLLLAIYMDTFLQTVGRQFFLAEHEEDKTIINKKVWARLQCRAKWVLNIGQVSKI